MSFFSDRAWTKLQESIKYAAVVVASGSSSSSNITTTRCDQASYCAREYDKSLALSQPESNKSRKSNKIDFVSLAVEIAVNTVLAVATLYLAKKIMAAYVADSSDEENVPKASVVNDRLSKILAKRNKLNNNNTSDKVEIPSLDSYELQMAQVVLDPDEIVTGFEDVGGLDDTKQEIYQLAVLPLVHPELFTGKLVQPCKGILLYGRPGTGKTLLAKALAKESRAVFIPLQLSKILNKYVGESNKLIAAAFSLAHKLQPSIIFIDEIDTFLKANSGETGQYLDTIKSEFLILWDGVTTAQNSRVLVLGATNKPHTIDPAIQRRMPRTFNVPLPNVEGRTAILNLFFQDEQMTTEARNFIPVLARATSNYSGSDLKELCKAAAMAGVQERSAEYARQRVMGQEATFSTDKQAMRPISRVDLENALKKVGRTGAAAHAYGRECAMQDQQQDNNNNSDGGNEIDAQAMRNLSNLLQSITNMSDNRRNDRNGESKSNDGDDEDVPNV